jgi:hypothetical protein
MLQILNEWRLEKVKNNHQKSYVSYKGKFSLFDHFFASKNLFSSESQSLGACEYPDNREYLENYRKYVSDHCPVINTIFLQ